MALDTRGLASGFAQGFGLMEQHQQRKTNNERADRQEQRQARQDERADQAWGMKMEDRNKEQSLEQIRAFYEQEAAGLMPEMTQDLDQAFEFHPHVATRQCLQRRHCPFGSHCRATGNRRHGPE